jgi:hypothetical protein
MSREVEVPHGKSIETELYELRQREIEQDILGAEHEAWNGNLCPDCGSPEGMAHYDRESVRLLMEYEADYTFPEDWWIASDEFDIPTSETHYLYRKCKTCRPMDAPRGWLQMPASYAQLWAMVPCVCKDCA